MELKRGGGNPMSSRYCLKTNLLKTNERTGRKGCHSLTQACLG